MGLKMSHVPEGQLVEYAGGGGSAPQMPARVSKFVDELPSKVKSAAKGAIKSIPSGHSIKGNEIQMNSNQLEGELIEERDEQKEEEKGQKETLANIKKITGKKQRLDKEKYTLQRKGKLPLNMSNEIQGEMTEEASDRARDRRQERGGVGGNVDYRTPPAKKLSNAELGIKPMTDEQREKRRKEIAAHFKKMKK